MIQDFWSFGLDFEYVAVERKIDQGTMENLLVFYGHIVREGSSGVDVSRCGMTTVVVKDMVNIEYAAVRRCIRAMFGSAMNGKK